jgi:N-acetyl-1-D-myo-inositol-2-amino-2-deoxy-alpha-D-glucopyranoside deacetylase
MTTEFGGYRIAAIFAHPDDEAYSCAGLLAMAAAGGAVVTVVSATRGEAGRDREGIVPPGPTLARLRTVELGLSCRAIGAQPPIFLDLPDGGLEGHPELAPRMRDIFKRLKPNVVITLGEDGAYGHRDHLAVTDAVMRQVMSMKEGSTKRSRRAEIRPRLLFVQFPKGLFNKVRRFMEKSMPHAVDSDASLFGSAETGIDHAAADIILDIRPWRGNKLNAMAAHRSQLRAGDPNSFLVPGLAESLLDRELYTCPAGPALPDGAKTPLDGIETE